MRKIEKRAVICMALAILLAAGMSVYFSSGILLRAASGPPLPLTAICTIPTAC